MQNGFSNPAGDVCRGSIDFAVVLARECPAAVCSPSTVSVDNDLAASETGITLWSTDDEEPRRLNLGRAISMRKTAEKEAYLRGKLSYRQDI